MERNEEDKKRYVEELNKTKAMFEGLFEFAPETIVVVNREGRIMQVNKQTEKRMFGYTREELVSADHGILLPERFREKNREHRRGYMSDPHVRPMGTGMERAPLGTLMASSAFCPNIMPQNWFNPAPRK